VPGHACLPVTPLRHGQRPGVYTHPAMVQPSRIDVRDGDLMETMGLEPSTYGLQSPSHTDTWSAHSLPWAGHNSFRACCWFTSVAMSCRCC